MQYSLSVILSCFIQLDSVTFCTADLDLESSLLIGGCYRKCEETQLGFATSLFLPAQPDMDSQSTSHLSLSLFHMMNMRNLLDHGGSRFSTIRQSTSTPHTRSICFDVYSKQSMVDAFLVVVFGEHDQFFGLLAYSPKAGCFVGEQLEELAIGYTWKTSSSKTVLQTFFMCVTFLLIVYQASYETSGSCGPLRRASDTCHCPHMLSPRRQRSRYVRHGFISTCSSNLTTFHRGDAGSHTLAGGEFE